MARPILEGKAPFRKHKIEYYKLTYEDGSGKKGTNVVLDEKHEKSFKKIVLDGSSHLLVSVQNRFLSVFFAKERYLYF
jgi:hypothetical protein